MGKVKSERPHSGNLEMEKFHGKLQLADGFNFL